MGLRILYNTFLATRYVGVFETTDRHLGLIALPRLRRTPGEPSIQDWRASYGNMDVVSFPYGQP